MPHIQESPVFYNELTAILNKKPYSRGILARSEERNNFIANEILTDLKEVIKTYQEHLYVSWKKYSVLESKSNEVPDIPYYTENFWNTSLVRENFGRCDHTGLTEKHVGGGIKIFFTHLDFRL